MPQSPGIFDIVVEACFGLSSRSPAVFCFSNANYFLFGASHLPIHSAIERSIGCQQSYFISEVSVTADLLCCFSSLSLEYG